MGESEKNVPAEPVNVAEAIVGLTTAVQSGLDRIRGAGGKKRPPDAS